MWRAKRSRMYEDDHDDDHFDESEEAEDEESEEAEDEESSDYNNDSDDEEHEDESDESNEKTSIKNRLREVLKIFETVGATEFVISGALLDAPLNLISIKRNKKIIRFPLFEEDLPLIIDAFKQSPYGKGTETIVDASFRNSWHLEPDDFEIMNPKWNSYVNDVLVARIRQEMALTTTTTFKASLYRLLLYRSGSFFKPHRDTEKEEGMFATLVVQLPSRFDGGQLVIEHDNITKKIDFNSNIEVSGHMYTTFFSAFYCDCKHEILPVTDGIRVCLVYNLVMTATNTSQELPIAPMVSGIEMKMANVCNEWRNTNGPPVKIVYGLSHKYTERSLSLKNLKSTDKSVADALIKFSKDHSLVVCLGTLEKTWQGDEAFLDDKYAEEEVEIDYSLKHLQMIGHPHIGIPQVSGMSMDQDELITKDCFRHVTPFDEQREETGNEGTTLTLLYRHSALVVFPIENAFAILMKRTESGERMFIDQCKQLKTVGGKDDTKKKQLLRWADVLIQKPIWPNEEISLEFLSALSTFNDLPLLQKYFENYILNKESIDPVIALCDTYGWNVFDQHLMTGLKKLNQQNALEVLDALVGKNADFVGKDEKRKFCLTLMDLIPGWKVDTFSYGYGYGRSYLKVEFVHKFCDLATRLRIDPKKHLAALPFEIDEKSIESVIKLCDTYGWDILSEQLVNGFKKLPQETALKVVDELVGSQADFVGKDEKKKVCLTLVDLVLKASNVRHPSGEFLYKFCVLAQRIDYDPTADLTAQRFETMIPVLVKIASTTKKVLEQRWRATAQHFLSQVQKLANSVNETPVWICSELVPCVCEDCVVLSVFIRANQKTTDFKVIKKRRLHLEKIVNGINNLTFTTESSGRPQKMTVAKTVPSSHAASQQQNVARTLMPKLTSILR